MKADLDWGSTAPISRRADSNPGFAGFADKPIVGT